MSAVLDQHQANPFQVAARPSAALAETDQQRAIAETQAAMVIAKKFPRDPISAMDRILQAFTRQSLAEAALYSYARAGTDITGPSIRTAEAIAQQWGNVQYGIREVEQRNGESTVEAYAWDVESNVRRVMQFQVKHERHTRKGSYKLEDPRDIYEMVANQGARRLRACILGIIPGDVVEAAVHQAETTLHTKAEVTPERIAKVLESFGKFGVKKEQIESRIQRRIDAITPALLVQLGKIYNSLKDGMSAPSDWFDFPQPQEPEPAGQSLREKVAAKRPTRATQTSQDEPPAESATSAPPEPADAPEAHQGSLTGPNLAEALGLVRSGDFAGARDLARALSKKAQGEVEAAIAYAESRG